MSAALTLLICGWAAVVVVILIGYRRTLQRLWREPVLGKPALVLESDDWGAGPLVQAKALRSIADVLASHSDVSGRHPVMSLAVVLAVPDGSAIASGRTYARIEVDAPMFSPVLRAMRDGLARGVFAIQLHGHEHVWPQTILSLSSEAASDWLHGPQPLVTELLPSHLQSRWVDASALPSKPLSRTQVQRAAQHEIQAYARIFGEPPIVVVPPTFVWTRDVERAWADGGVEFVVTPGWRSTERGADGLPGGDEGPISNGDREGRLTYLVRSDYFEPVRGRDASSALAALIKAEAEGRACVLENHRDNFVFEPEQCRRSLIELDRLCAGAIERFVNLHFLTTVELGRALRDRDPEWIVANWRERAPRVWRRIQGTGRLWKLLRLTGLAAAVGAAVNMVGQHSSGAKPPVSRQ